MGEVRIMTNQQLLEKKLNDLVEKKYIRKIHTNKQEDTTIYKLQRSSDGSNIEIKTNLQDKYEVVVDGFLLDFGDYGDFKTHVDWFMSLVGAYAKDDYLEERIIDKASGEVVFRKMVFNTTITGRRTVSNGVRFLRIPGLLRGKYLKQLGPPFG